eukprot:SAG31_NODE_24364_length_483_cov_0.804688_1_plen_80_part_00
MSSIALFLEKLGQHLEARVDAMVEIIRHIVEANTPRVPTCLRRRRPCVETTLGRHHEGVYEDCELTCIDARVGAQTRNV